MLQLYDVNHNKLQGLTNYKDFKIEREINIEDTLSFLYPILDNKSDLIQEECYIRTKENEYVIKEINIQDDDWTEYVCKVNLETIKGKDVSHFETVEQTCINAINLALAGTGWTIGNCDVLKLRTVRKNNITAYDVLKEIQAVYLCEMTFDAINKKIYIYQKQGSDKGTYFAEQLNLKKLNIQRNSYDYITRLILLGKDALDVTTINGGKNYVENYQYSNKVITAYWEDNRYTSAQDLLEDGTARLNYLSKPYKAYKADILDLSSNSVYSILDYILGDTITLLAKSKDIKEKQRIIKITEYPEEPERNTVEIANKVLKLEDLQVRFQDTSAMVDTVTTSDGSLDGTKIDGVDWSQLQNVHIVIADIQDLSVVTARIGTLETTTAHISNGVIDNAVIDVAKINNLSATYATITNLNVATGSIASLTTNVASINTLLAGNIGAMNLQVGAIQAGSAVIANGAIASAQIISLDVLKLIAGNISTNKFTVQSDNGNLKILGETIKLWDASGKERVSLGLNSGDYNLLIRGTDGTTVLFGTTGVTHAGITDGAVDDSKVATNASINGSKIEKESLVSQMNGAITLLKSSRVKYDPTGQTLEVAFGALSTTVTNQGTTITSQGTSITALNNSITTKVWTSDITTATNGINTNLTNNYSTTLQTANTIDTKVSVVSTNLTNNYSNTTSMNTAISTSATGTLSTVSATYATINTVNGKVDQTAYNSYVNQTATSIGLSVTAGALDGSKLVSSINVYGGAVKIAAKNIDISGLVTFTNLSTGTQCSINAGNIIGGTLLLGGASNGNGALTMKDASGNIYGALDKDGFISSKQVSIVTTFAWNVSGYGTITGSMSGVLSNTALRIIDNFPNPGGEHWYKESSLDDEGFYFQHTHGGGMTSDWVNQAMSLGNAIEIGSSDRENGVTNLRYGIGGLRLRPYSAVTGGTVWVDGTLRVSGSELSRTNIRTITDFNTALTEGGYYLGGGTFSNSPTGFSTYGKLRVYVQTGGTSNDTSDWIWQYIDDTNGNEYYRNKVNASAWGSWSIIARKTLVGDLTAATINANTVSGTLKMGAQNTAWCHFSTDRPDFHFDKNIATAGVLKFYGTGNDQIYTGSDHSFSFAQSGGNGNKYSTNPSNMSIYSYVAATGVWRQITV